MHGEGRKRGKEERGVGGGREKKGEGVFECIFVRLLFVRRLFEHTMGHTNNGTHMRRCYYEVYIYSPPLSSYLKYSVAQCDVASSTQYMVSAQPSNVIIYINEGGRRRLMKEEGGRRRRRRATGKRDERNERRDGKGGTGKKGRERRDGKEGTV